jgi:zinc transport system substrate-binding protein
VVAAFYPLQFVATHIGGDKVAVVNLTEPGVEPHDLELTPKQVGKIADADLVLYIKGFQPAVDEAVEQNPAKAVVEASTAAPFEETGAEAALESEEHAEEGTQEEGTEEEAHPGEEHGDPHIWLDPSKLAKITTAVSDRLAAADPGGAETYRANAAKLAGDLAALDSEYRAGLARCSRKAFVTSHAAFGYLAKRYGLEQVPIAGISPEEEPSPQRVAAVQQLVRDKGITTVFFETLVNPKLAETIARDTGARAEVLDPVEGIEAGSSADYFTVMRANLEALRKAMACT